MRNDNDRIDSLEVIAWERYDCSAVLVTDSNYHRKSIGYRHWHSNQDPINNNETSLSSQNNRLSTLKSESRSGKLQRDITIILFKPNNTYIRSFFSFFLKRYFTPTIVLSYLLYVQCGNIHKIASIIESQLLLLVVYD